MKNLPDIDVATVSRWMEIDDVPSSATQTLGREALQTADAGVPTGWSPADHQDPPMTLQKIDLICVEAWLLHPSKDYYILGASDLLDREPWSEADVMMEPVFFEKGRRNRNQRLCQPFYQAKMEEGSFSRPLLSLTCCSSSLNLLYSFGRASSSGLE